MEMIKAPFTFIICLAVLPYLVCRASPNDLFSHYENIFRKESCSKGILLLNLIKSLTEEDSNSQVYFLKPLQSCSTFSVEDTNNITYNLCDEVFTVLFNIYCNLTVEMDMFKETMNVVPKNVCSDFKKANFINSSEPYVSNSLKIPKHCFYICKGENGKLCAILLFVHKIQSALLELSEKSNMNTLEDSLNKLISTDLFHDSIFQSSTPKTKTSVSKTSELQLDELDRNDFTSGSATFISGNSNSFSSQNNKIITHKKNVSSENQKNDPIDTNSKESSSIKGVFEGIPSTKKHINNFEDKGLTRQDPQTPLNTTNSSDDVLLNANHNHDIISKNNVNDKFEQSTVTTFTVSSLPDKIVNKLENPPNRNHQITNLNNYVSDANNLKNGELDKNNLKDKNAVVVTTFANPSTISTQRITIKQIPIIKNESQSLAGILHAESQPTEISLLTDNAASTTSDFKVKIEVDDEAPYDSLDRTPEIQKQRGSVPPEFMVDVLPAGNVDVFSEQNDTHFVFYFLVIVISVILCYILFHNKQKILAVVVEGWHEKRRRPHGVSYRKLDT